jgi:two-component system response regulator NreC
MTYFHCSTVEAREEQDAVNRETRLEAPPPTVTIVIADDHEVVRHGLRTLLDVEPGFDVVDEAGDVPATRRSVAGHRPLVLVLDLKMPGGSSLDVIPVICALSPRTGVVVLTMEGDPAFGREALRAGALAYVLKESADDELVGAVRMAAQGRRHVRQPDGARPAESGARILDQPARLTGREREVLRLIAQSLTNIEIAEQLGLSVRTVDAHRVCVQQKVRRSSRKELVRYAVEHGLDAPDPRCRRGS